MDNKTAKVPTQKWVDSRSRQNEFTQQEELKGLGADPFEEE